MNPEINFFGVFAPSILPCSLLAALLTGALTRVLRVVGFYRFVWHSALFNFSIFVCALAAMLTAASRVSL